MEYECVKSSILSTAHSSVPTHTRMKRAASMGYRHEILSGPLMKGICEMNV